MTPAAPAALTRTICAPTTACRPIHDKLKVSRDNLCSACIAAMDRRDLAATLEWLDHERLFKPVITRRGQFLVQEEELRP